MFETFRRILHEGLIEKRTQYVIEQLFAVRRTEFEEYPRMAPELDLVEEGDQITHTIELNKEIDKEEYLDVFHVDPNYLENEETWKKIKMAILGEDESSDETTTITVRVPEALKDLETVKVLVKQDGVYSVRMLNVDNGYVTIESAESVSAFAFVKEEASVNYLMIILIGGAALIIIVGTVMFMLKKRG